MLVTVCLWAEEDSAWGSGLAAGQAWPHQADVLAAAEGSKAPCPSWCKEATHPSVGFAGFISLLLVFPLWCK